MGLKGGRVEGITPHLRMGPRLEAPPKVPSQQQLQQQQPTIKTTTIAATTTTVTTTSAYGSVPSCVHEMRCRGYQKLYLYRCAAKFWPQTQQHGMDPKTLCQNRPWKPFWIQNPSVFSPNTYQNRPWQPSWAPVSLKILNKAI